MRFYHRQNNVHRKRGYHVSSDILSNLKQDMPGFSKGQKRIAQYILESYDKAAFMTANKLVCRRPCRRWC